MHSLRSCLALRIKASLRSATPQFSHCYCSSAHSFPSFVHSSFCLFIYLPGIHSRLLVQLQRKEVKERILYDYYYFGDRVFLCRACCLQTFCPLPCSPESPDSECRPLYPWFQLGNRGTWKCWKLTDNHKTQVHCSEGHCIMRSLKFGKGLYRK